MELIKWVILGGIFCVVLRMLYELLWLLRNEITPSIEKLQLQHETTNKTLSQLNQSLSRLNEAHNLSSIEQKAFLEALSRIDSWEEMLFLKRHYFFILELLKLRKQGVKEEEIAKERMKYNGNKEKMMGFSLVSSTWWEGIMVPDKRNGRPLIFRVSPYRMATNTALSFSKLEKQFEEADKSEINWDNAVYKDQDGL